MPVNKITTTTTTKRKYVRKKGRSTYRRGRAVTRLPRIRTYSFKRTQEQLLALESGGDGWININPGAEDLYGNCIVKTFVFDMDSLPNKQEFANLYRQYKLNHVVAKMFPSYSQIVMTDQPVGTTNLIITIWPNTDGKALDGTFRNAKLLEIQGKKQYLMPQNKPVNISMPLKQLRNTYGGTLVGVPLVDYAVKKPSYIGTDELSTPHYGFNVHIRKVDGSTFASNGPRFLIKETVYFSCRQVH